MAEITVYQCDGCGAFPCATTHHPDKDVSLCGKCWKEAES